jgi:hypothetical protein
MKRIKSWQEGESFYIKSEPDFVMATIGLLLAFLSPLYGLINSERLVPGILFVLGISLILGSSLEERWEINRQTCEVKYERRGLGTLGVFGRKSVAEISETEQIEIRHYPGYRWSDSYSIQLRQKSTKTIDVSPATNEFVTMQETANKIREFLGNNLAVKGINATSA